MSCDKRNDGTILPLRFWCHKILPLVYDESLSYYELLCKVIEKVNEMAELVNPASGEIAALGIRVDELEKELEELKNGGYVDLIEKYIAEAIRMVFFGLTDSGYFVAYIPENWRDITFNTTEYDILIPEFTEYGHLTLSY